MITFVVGWQGPLETAIFAISLARLDSHWILFGLCWSFGSLSTPLRSDPETNQLATI